MSSGILPEISFAERYSNWSWDERLETELGSSPPSKLYWMEAEETQAAGAVRKGCDELPVLGERTGDRPREIVRPQQHALELWQASKPTRDSSRQLVPTKPDAHKAAAVPQASRDLALQRVV